MRRDGKPKRLRGQILKPTVNGDGYARVALSGRCRSVHQLVLESFVGPRPEGMQACHGDGVGTHNHLGNLRWDSISENQFDRVRHGTHQEAAKTHCRRRHPLIAPNLVPSHVRRGKRLCLACARAHACVARTRKKGFLLDFQDVSDAYYSEIIDGAKPTRRVTQRLLARATSGLQT